MKSRAECVKEYGSDYYVNQQIKTGKLFRIEKGIYSEKKNVPELAVLSYKYPKAVITMDTAFYLYDLTDEIPDLCTMATKREAAPIADGRVKQIFIPKELLSVGVTEIDYEGYSLQIFDKERMLVELVRYKSKFSFNYYKEIINNYRKILPRLNSEKVRNYAELMPKQENVFRILRTEVY